MLHNYLIVGVLVVLIILWALEQGLLLEPGLVMCPGVEVKPWGRMGIGTVGLYKKHVTYHQ